MIELIQIAQGIVERGIIFGFIVAGVYLSSRLIKFDNLAVEGAFGIGGACTALLMSWGVSPWIALAGAAGAGALSGVITGLLHTRLQLNTLISGIVVTTGLFSIILVIAGSNMIVGTQTIFSSLPRALAPYQSLLIVVILCSLLFSLMSWFLKTEVGFLLRAVGDTPQMVTNVGKSVEGYLVLGLVLSNMLAALSGALFVHYTGYFSIWTGVGVLIIGLAGMILAEMLSTNFGIALVIGSSIYQALIALTFELQLNQDWNKLVTATIIVLLLGIKQWIPKK